MRPRALLLFALAALLGAAVAVLPALAASPSEAKLEVNENCEVSTWACWTTEGSASIAKPTKSVMISSGGTITFIDHASTAAAVVWMGSAPACTGVPTSAMTNWEGKCTFATPGTYHFESSTLFNDGVDNYTKYEVVVEGSTTTPPTGTTGEGSKGGSTPATTGESPIGSPLSGAPRISSSQRGRTVKGSIDVSKAGAGDRLEVDLIATTASLAKAGHAKQVVGRIVSASVGAGQRSFSVKLNTKAKRALKRHHHLALKVKITLTSVIGKSTTVTRSVTLHA